MQNLMNIYVYIYILFVINPLQLPSSPSSPASGSDTLGRERVKQFTYDYSYSSTNPADKQYISQEQVSRVSTL